MNVNISLDKASKKEAVSFRLNKETKERLNILAKKINSDNTKVLELIINKVYDQNIEKVN